MNIILYGHIVYMYASLLSEINDYYYYRAVANGPVGPAMAGPIIEPVIFFFFPAGPIIEPVILIFEFFKIRIRHKRF